MMVEQFVRPHAPSNMDLQVYNWIFSAAVITALIPFVLILVNFSRQSPAFVWLAYSILFSVACDMAGRTLLVFKISPNYSSTAYWIFATIPVSIFFYYAIGWKPIRSYLKVINVLYLSFALSNFFFLQKTNVNSYSNILNSLIILILCIIYYYKLITELPTQQLQRLPLFWIVSAFFFSHAGKLAIYTVTHYLIHFVKDNMIIVWSFHNFLTVIGNLLIAYGAWLNLKQLRSTSLSL
jgi:hypothetical protein